jgi:putative membrane protein insertion efficiency factor
VYELKNGQQNLNPTLLCLCSNHKQMINFLQIKNTLILLKFSKKSKLTSLTNQIARLLILFYQSTFSYFFGGNCRYYPSCSHYALEAFSKHGPIHAGWLVLKRLGSCHPFSKKSFYDPVPLNSSEKSLYE